MNKVLVASITHLIKDYSSEKWLEAVSGIDYENYDVFVVDNSPKGEMAKKYKNKINIAWDEDISKNEDVFVRINRSMEVIRKKFLGGGYSHLFVLEWDVIPDKNILKVLTDYSKAGNDWVGHTYQTRNSGSSLPTQSGIGCCLLSRRLLEKYGWEGCAEGPDHALWIQMVADKSFKMVELTSHAKVRHLDGPGVKINC